MDTIPIKDTKGFVNDFLQEYLSNGIGAKNKREIDILVMNLLMNYAGLATKSNQELSILLQAPESKIKGLRYEARLKYPPDTDYVKREFLYILTKSQFDLEKGTIIFVIEDEFLRHAIQGQLKSKGMFADSSFNTELVKISSTSLESVIEELYGKQIVDDFRQGFDAMESQLEAKNVNVTKAFSDTIIAFAVETFKKLAFEFIRSRIGF
jgi:hypothetical protein